MQLHYRPRTEFFLDTAHFVTCCLTQSERIDYLMNTMAKQVRPVFHLIEDYMICTALGTLEMHGLLKKISNEDLNRKKEQENSQREALINASLEYLEYRNILVYKDSTYQFSDLGKQLYTDIGYLIWFIGGYGNVMSNLPSLIKNPFLYHNSITREGKWVAIGSAVIGYSDVKPYVWKMLNAISFHKVLDIGCGNASQLLSICEDFNCEGIGVDIDHASCLEAKKLVKEKGFDRKIEIIKTDAANINDIPKLEQVDLLSAFFLLHEIYNMGEEILVDYLRTLAKRLPNHAYFLIAEVVPPNDDKNQPFNSEFNFIHSMMMQTLPSKNQWVELLENNGFVTTELVPLDLPGGFLFLCKIK